jgi:hypothetical protein
MSRLFLSRNIERKRRARPPAISRPRTPCWGRSVSWAFPSCTRSILTEIYLCHACSCHEKLRMKWRRDARAGGRIQMATVELAVTAPSGGGGGTSRPVRW